MKTTFAFSLLGLSLSGKLADASPIDLTHRTFPRSTNEGPKGVIPGSAEDRFQPIIEQGACGPQKAQELRMAWEGAKFLAGAQLDLASSSKTGLRGGFDIPVDGKYHLRNTTFTQWFGSDFGTNYPFYPL
jgi:hypothetical protein